MTSVPPAYRQGICTESGCETVRVNAVAELGWMLITIAVVAGIIWLVALFRARRRNR
ncbi:hypothetical protein M3G03_11300 [Aestuariimicrobium sp. p3-SID1156]|uniref:hypothetical protein n=1 Tax=Aestuariimicrobium sp. p3-SID1156 TaxID=2916038 RepID=UPI00223BECC0|nr:hypothetical protein [Aestuariimicrobium sp. p3-SID1156]MCT1460114.1 hypothetical protein [Aestuariimicrobium sp. p3-SID1156]